MSGEYGNSIVERDIVGGRTDRCIVVVVIVMREVGGKVIKKFG
jgi:hypothetical protein